ncbi:MAG: hypothetical protein QM791_23575 [Ferruginibacter sp.]
MKRVQKSGIVAFIFYGNYFYGVCAVALTVEATLQQLFPLNDYWYLFLVFITTVLYYSYPYIQKLPYSNNPRTNWYSKNYNLMWWNQVIITIVLILAAIGLLQQHWAAILQMRLTEWLLLLVFPVVAGLYYGISFLSRKYNIRRIGWLKPFIIGFTWAGLVTVYPILFYDIIHLQSYEFTLAAVLLTIKNFMFVSVLCIMFDIKDYAADHVNRLKTFVVRAGLRKTIFNILLPLCIVGLVSFIYFALFRHFNPVRIILNIIPFLALLLVARSLRKRRTIMYYLVVVDGVMLVKAICGTIAILYF